MNDSEVPITDNSNHLVAGTLSDCMRCYVFRHTLTNMAKTIVNNKGKMLQINTVNKILNSITGFSISKYAETVKERYTAKSIMRTFAFLASKETIIKTYIVEPTCIENCNSVSSSLA